MTEPQPPHNEQVVMHEIRDCVVELVEIHVEQCTDPNCLQPRYRPLKHPKGGEPAEWPADLRVREFPATA